MRTRFDYLYPLSAAPLSKKIQGISIADRVYRLVIPDLAGFTNLENANSKDNQPAGKQPTIDEAKRDQLTARLSRQPPAFNCAL